ncbi:MAG: hypothetical protein ACK5HR_01705 [Mycoplasmatales bacterium]
MNTKLEKYIAFHDQKIKKAMYRRKYKISVGDKEILKKVIAVAKADPALFISRKEEFNYIIIKILKRSKL